MTVSASTGTALILGLMLAAGEGATPESTPAAEPSGSAATERVAQDDLGIHLSPRTARGPSDVRALVRVVPHPENRLRVTIDSGAYYRSTFIQLDGDYAPRNHLVYWQRVPPGEYVLVATLYGPRGDRERTARQVTLLLMGQGEEFPDVSARPPRRPGS